MTEDTLLLWVILTPLVGAIVVALGGRRSALLREPVAVLASLATLLVCGGVAAKVFGPQGAPALVAPRSFWVLRADAFSTVFICLVSVLLVLVMAYSVPHMRALARAGKVAETRLSLFYALVLCFAATMIWACATDNIIVLFLAVEATTLASALLVTFYWNKRSLEAGYKYMLLLTVGITFALFGCVLLFAANSAYLGAGHHYQSMLISEIARNATALVRTAPSVVVLATAFLIIGFGTKAGLVPFHPWLPDAHAEAPSPVSVLLSGIMIKVAAYALARTAVPFFTAWPALQVMLVAMATLTMLVGIALVAAQVDLKRLLAYSSVSQIGYVILGFGLGSYLGVFAALYHVLAHAAAKSLLFMGAGAVEQSTGTRRLDELRGLRVSMPITSACFLVGVLTLSGVPLLAGFVSKFSLFLATVQLGGFWWAGVIAILTGVLTLVVMTRVVVQVFWRAEGEPARARSEVSAAMVGSMVVLALLCVLLGTGPTLLWPALSQATQALLGSTQPVGELIAAFRP